MKYITGVLTTDAGEKVVQLKEYGKEAGKCEIIEKDSIYVHGTLSVDEHGHLIYTKGKDNLPKDNKE